MPLECALLPGAHRITKRAHNLAKELGVPTKLIVNACRSNGVPPTVMKNHMSIVSPELERLVRHWLRDMGNGEPQVKG